MDIPVDDALVERIASLAGIEVSSAEKDRLLEDIRTILAYFDRLRRLEVDGEEPPALEEVPGDGLREDDIRPSLPAADLASQAPDASGGFFRVPDILEGG